MRWGCLKYIIPIHIRQGCPIYITTLHMSQESPKRSSINMGVLGLNRPYNGRGHYIITQVPASEDLVTPNITWPSVTKYQYSVTLQSLSARIEWCPLPHYPIWIGIRCIYINVSLLGLKDHNFRLLGLYGLNFWLLGLWIWKPLSHVASMIGKLGNFMERRYSSVEMEANLHWWSWQQK